MANAFRTGQRICFRPAEIERSPIYQAWINDPENHQFLARFRPLNGLEERQWLEKAHERKEHHLFEIALREGERPIGLCSLGLGEQPHRSGELGISIGEREFQGKGFGSEAIGLLLDYGFLTLGLHRIQLFVYENNPRAIRCYEKCGFRREGAIRDHTFLGGQYYDSIVMSITEDEFRAKHPFTPPGMTNDE